MNDKMIEEMASCDNCIHKELCYYQKIAFEQGHISFDSHINKVKKNSVADTINPKSQKARWC